MRRIRRAELTEHANPDFRIAVVDDPAEFYRSFADDIVGRIRAARDEGRTFVAILPVGPMPQYELAARMINEERIALDHVHTFNMDEYANEDGVTAPVSWPGSFQRAMQERFFALVDPELRPPDESDPLPDDRGDRRLQRASSRTSAAPTSATAASAGAGTSRSGSRTSVHEFAGDLDAYKQAGARLVELHPMTIMQNALHSFGGDWSWVPPKANTIGPREILGARHRSFWLDGDLGGGVSWQRFIARLVAHGPVSEFVPGSILQTARTDYTILGAVADDVEIHMA